MLGGLIDLGVGLRQRVMQILDILSISTWLIGSKKPKDQVDWKPRVPAKHQVVRRVSSRVMSCAVLICVLKTVRVIE